MKKVVSMVLCIAMICALIPATIVFAEEAPIFKYALPDVKLARSYYSDSNHTSYWGYNGYIAVNKEQIKLVFDKEIDGNTIGAITFKASDGTEPIGGVIKSVDENIVILKFGELKENETYTVTIPETVADVNGNTLSKEEQISYTTREKISVEIDPNNMTAADFEDTENAKTTYYAEGSNNSYVPDFMETGYFIRLANDSGSNGQKVQATYSLKTENEKKVLNINNDYNKQELVLGISLPQTGKPAINADGTNDFSEDLKIVSVLNYKLNMKNPSSEAAHHNAGSLYHYGTTSIIGVENERSINENVSAADEQGYRNIQTVSEKYDTETASLNGNAYLFTTKGSFSVLSLDYYKFYEYPTRDKSTADANNGKLIAYGALRSYSTEGENTDSYDIAYMKTGTFVVPKILGEAVYTSADKTVKFTMNTDIDDTTLSNISLKDAGMTEIPFTASYNKQSRQVTLQLEDTLFYSTEYTIEETGVKSVDGITSNEEYTFTDNDLNDR